MKTLDKKDLKNVKGGRKPAPIEWCCVKWQTPGTECLAYARCEFE